MLGRGRGRGSGRGSGGGGRGRGQGRGTSRTWTTKQVTDTGAAASISLDTALKSSNEIYIKYLPPKCTAEEVHAFFRPCGAIAGDVRLMYHNITGNVIRGFITFETEEGFKAALEKNLTRFQHRNISVEPATTTGTMQAEGTHTPAMLAEVLRRLVHNPDGVYVDGTFGRGGHSRAILEKLSPTGRLHAFDVDEEAIKVGKELMQQDSRFVIHQRWFGDMAAELGPLGIQPAGVLLDIGISSPQLDGGRGFRPEMDGPLDLRFDKEHGQSAWDYLQTCTREHFQNILVQYGGENCRAAARIADVVLMAREGLWPGGLPRRTREFASLVAAAKGVEYQAMHPAKMTFQALRIHINREFEELKRGMTSALKCLKPGGKLGIITWKHSECAIVVDYFRHHEVTRQDFPILQWYLKAQKALKSGDRSLQPAIMRPEGVEAVHAASTPANPTLDTEDNPNRWVAEEEQEEEEGNDNDASSDEENSDSSDDSSDQEPASEKANKDARQHREKRHSNQTKNTTNTPKRLNAKTRRRLEMKQLRKLPRGWGFLMEDVSRPTPEEVKVNSRSRSALLHVLEKKKGVLASALAKATYPLFGWGRPMPLPAPVPAPSTLQEGLEPTISNGDKTTTEFNDAPARSGGKRKVDPSASASNTPTGLLFAGSGDSNDRTKANKPPVTPAQKRSRPSSTVSPKLPAPPASEEQSALMAEVTAALKDTSKGSLAHRLQPGHLHFDPEFQAKWNAKASAGGLTKKQKAYVRSTLGSARKAKKKQNNQVKSGSSNGASNWEKLKKTGNVEGNSTPASLKTRTGTKKKKKKGALARAKERAAAKQQ